MKTIVAFNIRRGGRFNNQGHKYFMPNIEKLSDCFEEGCIVLSEDEEGNPLPDEEWELIDGGSNVILRGRDAIESETGILDWDGQYNTDIVKYLDECDEEEFRLIYEAYTDGEWIDDEVIKAACTALGIHLIDDVKFFKSNAEIQCHDCTIHYEWDGEDVTEEDAADWMREKNIDILSIEKWADSFESHFYND